jgi:hypothetical protein
MPTDANKKSPEFAPPDEDVVYAGYLETCRRLGVEPVPRVRAHELMAEWGAALAGCVTAPPTTH